jgi:hypothetical protein
VAELGESGREFKPSFDALFQAVDGVPVLDDLVLVGGFVAGNAGDTRFYVGKTAPDFRGVLAHVGKVVLDFL